MNPEQIVDLLYRAQVEATAATEKHLKDYPNEWYPCGFAWVIIKPARGPLVSAMKARGIGDKAYNGGWQYWNPSRNGTQCMRALMAGAEAYAERLRKEGFDAHADCRID
jgi:hypothetical protein